MTPRTTLHPNGRPQFSSKRLQPILTAVLVLFAVATPAASATKWCRATKSTAVRSSATPAVNPCVRYAPRSVAQDPEDLFSVNGTLTVNLFYNTGTDPNGLTLFCFTTADGTESPTLHLNPGDTLIVNVTNNLPAPAASNDMKLATSADTVCGDTTMNSSSVNIHYHGTNSPPTCHADEVIHTLVNSGESFTYTVPFPADEPPGAYWYHPHVHGISEMAVQGGASGAIIIDGVENVQPKVAGLPERVFVIRDQPVPPSAMVGDPEQIPAWDVSLNYVPILYPNYQPATIQIGAKEKQFWRVVNASADTIIDLQLKYDGRVQPLYLEALDGVPIGSQDGARKGSLQTRGHLLIPPASRAEFIIIGPAANVNNALLWTNYVDTGPAGDYDPLRPLASLQVVSSPTSSNLSAAATHRMIIPQVSHAPGPQRFEGLATAAVTARRSLYFSETGGDSDDGREPTEEQEPTFFITVKGAPPTAFNPNNPPAITTTQGSVEDWTIENRTMEAHEFHIHQIHFLLLARNGQALAPAYRQYLDMIHIPYWRGKGPFPSVKVRMDFRGPDIGDFVYHCHILEHEDNGMMAIIRVLPASASSRNKPALREATSGHGGVKLINLAK